MSSTSPAGMKTTAISAHFDGMAWPRPGQRLADLAWRLRYAQESITPSDLLIAASVMDAYEALIARPLCRAREILGRLKTVAEFVDPSRRCHPPALGARGEG